MKKLKKAAMILLAVMLLLLCVPWTKPVHAAKGDKLVALTFDDGPHKTYTTQLLDGLKQKGVKVTFFMVGTNASSNTALVQRAYDEGHEIGNHSYSHPNLNTLGYSGVRGELSRTASILDKACGAGTDYLVRPPYGNANATVLSALASPAIIWSVDTNDWKYRDADHVYNHIVNNASDGAIILCHDIYSTTVKGALRAVDTLKARGYEFVTVSELYRRRGVSMQDGVKLYNCKKNGVDYGPVEKPIITYEPIPGGIRVSMHSPSGAPIYFTVNGARFTNQSTLYTGSFGICPPVKIEAVAAFDLNGGRSEKTTFTLTTLPCDTPSIEIKDGTASINCKTSGASIHYTIDGTKATPQSNPYTGAIKLNPGTTVRAVAGGGDYFVSSEVIKHYSENGNVFADIFPGDWYYSSVDELVSLGLMYGLGNDVFAPKTDTSRAMLVTMLYRYSGETMKEGWTRTNTFPDVEDGMWYSEAIEWAYRNKIVNGYADGKFYPDKTITRQEMAKVFVDFASYLGYELNADPEILAKFQDETMIHEWAKESAAKAVNAGLMFGDTNSRFQPQNGAARAESGAVLVRIIELEEKQADSAV